MGRAILRIHRRSLFCDWPEDFHGIEVVTMQYDLHREWLEVLIEHPDLPEVAEGGTLEVLDPKLRKEPDGSVTLISWT